MAAEDFMQVDIARELHRLKLEHLQDPNPGRRGAWRPLHSERDRKPWVALPASGVRPGFFSSESVPFPSRQHSAAMASVNVFQDTRGCDLRLNGETGLPDFLYGNL